MLDVAFLIAGLGLLTVAADKFVEGAVAVATQMRVPVVLVGALVIGFGTSAPELLVSALASIDGKQDIALGNIVGSNIANLTLVTGAAAAFSSLPITVQIWRREVRLMLASLILLAGFAYDRRVDTWEALVLLVAAAGAISLLIVWARMDRAQRLDRELETEVIDEYDISIPLSRAWALTVLGLLGTLAGAQLLVDGASGLATALGVSEAVIGLTIVAIGTSLPELVTAVAAARHGEKDLIVGNVVGSNIFNSLPVAGVAGVLDTTQLSAQFPTSLVLMGIVALLFAVFARQGFTIRRSEGLVLLAAFGGATLLTV